MAGPNAQKRRLEEAKRKAAQPPRPRKKIKKQREYHSSSSDSDPEPAAHPPTQDFQAVNLLESSDEEDIHAAAADDGAPSPSSSSPAQSSSDESSPSDSDSDARSNPSGPPTKSKKSKRNDPTAFATSLTKILHTKLPTSRRADPVLSRSAPALSAAQTAQDAALDAKARRQLREQRKQAKEKGRVRDVLVGPVDPVTGAATQSVSAILGEERRLKKVATRGVVKMFNAIRQAQVGARAAERENVEGGVVGRGGREERVAEMSKEAFLELVKGGGGKRGRKERG